MFPLSLLTALPLLACAAPTGPLGGPQKPMSQSDTDVLHLALFLEQLEYSLFSGGCSNFTDGDFDSAGFPAGFRNEVVCATAIQEEDHIGAITRSLESAGKSLIPKCSYKFPYNGTLEFVNLANMVTTVGIGAYIGGGTGLVDNIPLLTVGSSILPVEARHNAALRYGQPSRPSPFPTAFDTALTAAWAYNLAVPFVDSCPQKLNLPVFPALNLTSPVPLPPMSPNAANRPSNVTFKWDANKVSNRKKTLYFAWVNSVTNVTFIAAQTCGSGCGTSVVPAAVNGTAFVILTDTNDLSQTPTQLTDNTLAGPAEVVLA